MIINSSDLPLLPPPGEDLQTTITSKLKVGGALAGVVLTMVGETIATLALADKLTALLSCTSPPHGILALAPYLACTKVQLGVILWQSLSYLLSPLFLQLGGKTGPGHLEATKLWERAAPLTSLQTGTLKGGKALSWGLAGKIFFSSAMWKMRWAGKTLNSTTDVSMLEFKAINCIPLPKFSLGPLGKASVYRSTVGGKTSVAFAYKFLPIVDHLRRLHAGVIIGKMMIGNSHILYFTLEDSGKGD